MVAFCYLRARSSYNLFLMYGLCYCISRMGWQQRSKFLGSKSKSAHLVSLPYWYPAFLQQTQLSIELLLNIFHSSGAAYVLWMYRILPPSQMWCAPPRLTWAWVPAIPKCCITYLFLGAFWWNMCFSLPLYWATHIESPRWRISLKCLWVLFGIAAPVWTGMAWNDLVHYELRLLY